MDANTVLDSILSISFVGYLFIVIMAIIWFFLPFAIFGIKTRLDEQIAGTEETNRLLVLLTERQKNTRKTNPRVTINGKSYDLIHVMNKFGIEQQGDQFLFNGQSFASIQEALVYVKAQS